MKNIEYYCKYTNISSGILFILNSGYLYLTLDHNGGRLLGHSGLITKVEKYSQYLIGPGSVKEIILSNGKRISS